MRSNQFGWQTVTLETIGDVQVSWVHLRGDGMIRPWQYHEVALLWGDHWYIVDSNIAEESVARGQFEVLTEAAELAKYIHTTVTREGWDN